MNLHNSLPVGYHKLRFNTDGKVIHRDTRNSFSFVHNKSIKLFNVLIIKKKLRLGVRQ